MPEKWREIYTNEQIEIIQKIELQNLRVLINICEKLDIQFILYGGSLLGAVRHGGFIPWDDDLDIAMMRDDYIRFVKEASAYLPENYILQTPYNDKKTPYIYTKLRVKGTRCIEYEHHKIQMEQGIYVDIYPIDNIPDDDRLYFQAFKKYRRWVRLYIIRQVPYPSKQNMTLFGYMKALVKRVLSLGLRIVPQGAYIKKIDSIMTQFNSIETKRKGNLSYPEPKNLFYDMLPFEDALFEGISVKIPRNWSKHLSARYGKYMEFPPEEERIGHRPYILDFGEFKE